MDKHIEIMNTLKDKYKNDNVALILACENYRGDADLFNKLISTDIYKNARAKVVAQRG